MDYSKNYVKPTCLNGFCELVKELNGDPALILQKHDIDVKKLTDENYIFPYSEFCNLLEDCSKIFNCSDFGIRLAKKQDHNILGPVAFIVISAATVEKAIVTVGAYLYFFTPAIKLSLEDISGTTIASLEIRDRTGEQFPQATEHMVTACFEIIRIMINHHLIVDAIWFKHAPISSENTYKKHFPVTVKFNRSHNGNLLSPKALQEKMPSGNSALYKIIVKYLDENKHEGLHQSLDTEVRDLIKKIMPTAKLSRAFIAEHLNMNERSLHRRLKECGYTYEQLLDSVRKQEAEKFMRDNRLPISQISGLLGYSEQSSFNRAFKRWYGVAPRDYFKNKN